LVLFEATDVDAVPSGNWAPGDRPVRAVAGVYTEWKYDRIRKG
jgi:hypothetical protein